MRFKAAFAAPLPPTRFGRAMSWPMPVRIWRSAEKAIPPSAASASMALSCASAEPRAFLSAFGTYCRTWSEWRGNSEICGAIKKAGDDYARVAGNGTVVSTFKILKGNPEGL